MSQISIYTNDAKYYFDEIFPIGRGSVTMRMDTTVKPWFQK